MGTRTVRLPIYPLVTNQTVDTETYYTPATDTRNLDRMRYIVVWDNGVSPDMDLQLQSPYNLQNSEETLSAKDSDGNLKIDSHADWSTYDIATVNPPVSGVSGSHEIDVIEIPNRFVRLKISYTSGEARFSVFVEGKGVS